MLRATLTVFVLVITRVFPPVLVCCSTLRTRERYSSPSSDDATLQHTAPPHTVNCCRFIIMVWLLWGLGGEDANDWCNNSLFSQHPDTGTDLYRGTTHCLAGGQEVIIVLHYLDKYFYCKLNHDSTKIVMNLGTLSCCEHIEMIRVMIPVFDTFLNITAPVLFKYQSCAVYTTQLTFQS